ncbi:MULTISPECIES: sensor histidine kinase [unclassified Arthrobacter]|uniref:ATP-binding protein n=1 Tax=unclassified Arthrobacter TaxID=235627 RepID=UPI00159EA159|nr:MULTISPECIES: sensor histidine kinase [unclassified Arthrobacter]MCQ9162663.1 sensor histidine kinase [Arthrobacter sp. STN4]NVM97354.1 sensor histidine kinase [Arthrobacter sp. SDTb3-6]
MTLTTQILLSMLSLLLLAVVLGAFLFTVVSNQTLDRQYQLRALGIATTTAAMPEVRSALEAKDPHHTIAALAREIVATANPSYVVVTDRNGIRYSHPNPALIGKKLEEPVAVLDGKTHLGFDPGSLGLSANAKAPIFSADGAVIGEVSVGILDTRERDEQAANIWLIAGFSALVLLLSIAGSLLLSRRIKRVTFNLEPSEIAFLLQEREALLHGIREAVIGLDDDGRVTVINEEARRLLKVEGTALGMPVAELVPDGRLRQLLTGRLDGVDQVALTEDALLVVNRMPVSIGGRSIGSVVTLRDRTEIEGLVRDLHSVQGLMEAMRALEHEYANRLYVVDGLLELGDVAQARTYVSQISESSRSLGEGLRSRIAPPELAALLLAKITVAAEQDVQIKVTAESRLERPLVDAAELLTVVGNLLDNAVDALAGSPRPRTVTVQLDDADGVFIAVRDNGPGVPADRIDAVVVDGYSTKDTRPGMRRGIGLALVRRIVHRAGGTLDVFPGPGGNFEVWLPAQADVAGTSGTAGTEARDTQ